MENISTGLAAYFIERKEFWQLANFVKVVKSKRAYIKVKVEN